MDSFDSIVLPTSDVPTNQDGGGGNNGYCVVFQNAGPTDTPSDQDGGGGNNGYCVIAWAVIARDPLSSFNVLNCEFEHAFLP